MRFEYLTIFDPNSALSIGLCNRVNRGLGALPTGGRKRGRDESPLGFVGTHVPCHAAVDGQVRRSSAILVATYPQSSAMDAIKRGPFAVICCNAESQASGR